MKGVSERRHAVLLGNHGVNAFTGIETFEQASV
jgi:hypothetical protein